jgi:hypothetical protein
MAFHHTRGVVYWNRHPLTLADQKALAAIYCDEYTAAIVNNNQGEADRILRIALELSAAVGQRLGWLASNTNAPKEAGLKS